MLFSYEEFWLGLLLLKKAEFLIVIWVSPVTLFANIVGALVKEIITLTIDKVLYVVYNEGGSISNVSKF